MSNLRREMHRLSRFPARKPRRRMVTPAQINTAPSEQGTGSKQTGSNGRRRGLITWHPDTIETLSARPEDYSPITSTSRLRSLRYALAGWLYMLRYQKNTRIQAVFSLAVFVVGFWAGIGPLEWALLILIITINWMAEFVNAAIEAAINVASPNLHPMARVGKDVGAAAVLLTSVAAVMIGALVLGPSLLARIEPLIIGLIQK